MKRALGQTTWAANLRPQAVSVKEIQKTRAFVFRLKHATLRRMSAQHLYLTHPQVRIDPDVEITRWGLNDEGRARVTALAASGVLEGIDLVISSAETKAVETATPLADSIGCELVLRSSMHENGREATGFLPPDQFEATADAFFENPDKSIKGWETSLNAQLRIIGEVEACLALYPDQRILFVGHGAVGTLLLCHLAQRPISRSQDQPAGGGCVFAFGGTSKHSDLAWQKMETLYASAPS